MGGHFKFEYEVLNWTAPNRITPNRIVWIQTKAPCQLNSSENSTGILIAKSDAFVFP